MADSIASPAPGGSSLAPGTRRALAGCFVTGLLLSFIGAILPAWGHHVTGQYLAIACYFLAFNGGILGSLRLIPMLLPAKGAAFVLAAACVVATVALVYLAFVGPPSAWTWRIPGLVALGAAAGLIQASIFQAIAPMYDRDPTATVNLAGTFFGIGCLSMALLVSGTYYAYTVPVILLLTSIIPAAFAFAYARVRYPYRPLPQQVSLREGLRQFTSPLTVLLALLLFFQFGNEWAIAGWLPLFLVQQLGISPPQSLQMLALYWLAIVAGRIVSQSVLPRFNHARLLAACAGAAVFGATVLALTNNRFGAITGVLLIGGAYAPIFPLVAERMGSRIPNYHPGLYTGIFSVAFTGALLAPCTIGIFAELWGIRAVMGLPVAGTVMVLVLIGAMYLEDRFFGPKRATASVPPEPRA